MRDRDLEGYTERDRVTPLSGFHCIYFVCVGCKKVCPEKQEPVCASNKVTYANKCEFENAACTSVDITFVSIGPCGKYKNQMKNE